MRKLFYILVCIVAVLQLGSFISLNLGGGLNAQARKIGLQTNQIEIARFNTLWSAEGGSGPIQDDRAELQQIANSAKDSWATLHDIAAGTWGSENNECAPNSGKQFIDNFDRNPTRINISLDELSNDITCGGSPNTCEWEIKFADHQVPPRSGNYTNFTGTIGVHANRLFTGEQIRARLVNNATNQADTISQYAAVELALSSGGYVSGVTLRDEGLSDLGTGSFYAFTVNSIYGYSLWACDGRIECEELAFIPFFLDAGQTQVGPLKLWGTAVGERGHSLGVEVEGTGDDVKFNLWHWSNTNNPDMSIDGIAYLNGPPARENWGNPHLTVCQTGCDYTFTTLPSATSAGPADIGKRGGIITRNPMQYRFDNWMFGDSSSVGGSTNVKFDAEKAASDIFAMTLYGAMLDTASAGSGDAYFAAAKTRINEFEAITSIEFGTNNVTDPNTNTCIYDFSIAVPQLIESAWLMEDVEYTSWSENDRNQLVEWMKSTIFTPISWAALTKKNYWGISAIGGTMAIAEYSKYTQAGEILTLYPDTTVDSVQFISTRIKKIFDEWISNKPIGGKDTFRDSTCNSYGLNFPYGLQATGAFPDELIVEGGSNNCDATSISFSCPSAISSPVRADCGQAHYQQQLATVGLSKVCEMFRRIDGDGRRCFDISPHDTGPNPNQALYDAIVFSTTEFNVTGGSYQGTFNDYYTTDEAQAYRYVAGTYYNDFCMYFSLNDGTVGVRGGNNYPFAKITHREGVAHSNSFLPLSFYGCAAFGTPTDPESIFIDEGANIWNTGVWDTTIWGN
jgi:hypothetical protein